MDVGEGIVVHRPVEIDRIKHPDLVGIMDESAIPVLHGLPLTVLFHRADLQRSSTFI